MSESQGDGAEAIRVWQDIEASQMARTGLGLTGSRARAWAAHQAWRENTMRRPASWRRIALLRWHRRAARLRIQAAEADARVLEDTIAAFRALRS